jgi:hypothetical protein
MPNKEPARAEVLRGTLDLMLLQTLAITAEKKAWDRMVSVMQTLFEDPA